MRTTTLHSAPAAPSPRPSWACGLMIWRPLTPRTHLAPPAHMRSPPFPSFKSAFAFFMVVIARPSPEYRSPALGTIASRFHQVLDVEPAYHVRGPRGRRGESRNTLRSIRATIAAGSLGTLNNDFAREIEAGWPRRDSGSSPECGSREAGCAIMDCLLRRHG